MWWMRLDRRARLDHEDATSTWNPTIPFVWEVTPSPRTRPWPSVVDLPRRRPFYPLDEIDKISPLRFSTVVRGAQQPPLHFNNSRTNNIKTRFPLLRSRSLLLLCCCCCCCRHQRRTESIHFGLIARLGVVVDWITCVCVRVSRREREDGASLVISRRREGEDLISIHAHTHTCSTSPLHSSIIHTHASIYIQDSI